jgi:hypothetical protein
VLCAIAEPPLIAALWFQELFDCAAFILPFWRNYNADEVLGSFILLRFTQATIFKQKLVILIALIMLILFI